MGPPDDFIFRIFNLFHTDICIIGPKNFINNNEQNGWVFFYTIGYLTTFWKDNLTINVHCWFTVSLLGEKNTAIENYYILNFVFYIYIILSVYYVSFEQFKRMKLKNDEWIHIFTEKNSEVEIHYRWMFHIHLYYQKHISP